MTSQGPMVHPPCVASWLVDLFAPIEQAESVAGDLHEEFADLAAESGVALARRWYWRQSVKTIAHFVGAGFSAAPRRITAAVLGGYLLLAFGGSWPEQAIVGVLDLRRHHVYPYYTRVQFQSYLFRLNNEIWIGHLIMSLLVGSFVAAAARGREMVATMTLGLVPLVMTVAMFSMFVAMHRSTDPNLLPFVVLSQFGSSTLIATGGVIVRQIRSAKSRRRSALLTGR